MVAFAILFFNLEQSYATIRKHEFTRLKKNQSIVGKLFAKRKRSLLCIVHSSKFNQLNDNIILFQIYLQPPYLSIFY